MACDDLRCGHTQLRHLVRIDPDTQRVLSAEDLHTGYALDARDLVLQVDDGVVGQEVLAQLVARGVDGDEHQGRGERLLHGEAGGGDLGGKLGLGLVDAKLREDLVDVRDRS